jgi:hypothetical protein
MQHGDMYIFLYTKVKCGIPRYCLSLLRFLEKLKKLLLFLKVSKVKTRYFHTRVRLNILAGPRHKVKNFRPLLLLFIISNLSCIVCLKSISCDSSFNRPNLHFKVDMQLCEGFFIMSPILKKRLSTADPWLTHTCHKSPPPSPR